MAPESRAEYFRKRRESQKHFGVYLPREKADAMEARLSEMGKTKTEWLIEKIDEEISPKNGNSDTL